MPFSDVQDFADVERGFVAALGPAVVKNAAGDIVWDGKSYACLEEDCPPTGNPSLWRQWRLCARQGLFEIADRIYQMVDWTCRT